MPSSFAFFALTVLFKLRFNLCSCLLSELRVSCEIYQKNPREIWVNITYIYNFFMPKIEIKNQHFFGNLAFYWSFSFFETPNKRAKFELGKGIYVKRMGARDVGIRLPPQSGIFTRPEFHVCERGARNGQGDRRPFLNPLNFTKINGGDYLPQGSFLPHSALFIPRTRHDLSHHFSIYHDFVRITEVPIDDPCPQFSIAPPPFTYYYYYYFPPNKKNQHYSLFLS